MTALIILCTVIVLHFHKDKGSKDMAKLQRNVSFSLGSHDQSFIESQVLDGRFGNKTEVVRAGLRLLEDYENKQKALRTLVDEGYTDIKASRVTEYDNEEALFNDIMKD